MYAVDFQHTLSELAKTSPFQPFVVEIVNESK
jgi:hypothetical protein